jgi:hypothetical protein
LKAIALSALVAGAMSVAQANAQAPEWPKAKPIQWLVGFAPGGAADTVTRAVAERVSKQIGQAIVVENRRRRHRRAECADIVAARRLHAHHHPRTDPLWAPDAAGRTGS